MISIHALLAESDTGAKSHDPGKILFLSTLSLRRATSLALYHAVGVVFLSTLSLRRATCNVRITHNPGPGYFYPRSPCGERPGINFIIFDCEKISIHALLAESDTPLSIFVFIILHFYPRSPCGERLSMAAVCKALSSISIHALLAESDHS